MGTCSFSLFFYLGVCLLARTNNLFYCFFLASCLLSEVFVSQEDYNYFMQLKAADEAARKLKKRSAFPTAPVSVPSAKQVSIIYGFR